MKKKKAIFLQLPAIPPAAYASTGNQPLAAGLLRHSFLSQFKKYYHSPDFTGSDTDYLSDSQLVDSISSEKPDILFLSIYLWNSERSLYIASEIKKQSPQTKIVIGGPEVNLDNTSLWENLEINLAVCGSADSSFQEILTILKSQKKIQHNLKIPILHTKNTVWKKNFIHYTSMLHNKSVSLETTRGCASSCIYCFYPKSFPNRDMIAPSEILQLMRKLLKNGTKEFIFLDPTFNHRIGFFELLEGISKLRNTFQFQCFAEIRPEGINQRIANILYNCGFEKLEIGLQSLNPSVLKTIRRHGSPEAVFRAVDCLLKAGIEPMIDLILGLPDETPDEILHSIRKLKNMGLGSYLQIFPLSILPGTELRKNVKKFNYTYMKSPPYRILSSPNLPPGALGKLIFEIEKVLDRPLDEVGRIHLADSGKISRSTIFKNSRIHIQRDKKQSNHNRLFIQGNINDYSLTLIREKIRYCIDQNPFCILDLILKPDNLILKSTIRELENEMLSSRSNYLFRYLSHKKENMQFRICIVIHSEIKNISWYSSLKKQYPIFIKINALQSLLTIKKYLAEGFYFLISKENITTDIYNNLIMLDESEKISFEDPVLEGRWTRDALGLGD